MKRYERGFTIVELLIVIAIIGVLASILIPAFDGVIDYSNTQIVDIYNNINSKDSEIIVKDNETQETIYQGLTSEWQEKSCYELVSFDKTNDILILYVRRN